MDSLRLRPAVLPDDSRLLVCILIVEGAAGIFGTWYFDHGIIMLVALGCILIFPGLPLLIHSFYHFGVHVLCDSVSLTVTDWLSSPFVETRGRQRMEWQQLKYVYSLSHEIDFWEEQPDSKTEGTVSADVLAVFRQSRFNLKKWSKLHGRARNLAEKRFRQGLVLSSADGKIKVYFMYFADLSKRDQKSFTQWIRAQQSDAVFFMRAC